jgi:glycosyltransferase involved in cell wall biosynthesis
VRVLFLQPQPCIRALKYAVALRSARPDIRLGFAYQGRTLTGWYGSGDELFDGWWALPATSPAAALARAVDEFRPDLVHSHNPPDSLTVLALDVLDGRVPVIHDCHDLQSLRRTPYEDGFDDPEDPLALESAAIEGCAALVAVSREMLDAIEARHRVPARTLLFANYALERDLAPGSAVAGATPGDPPRVVYQGSVSANGSHYDLRDALVAIASSGLPVDVYPNRDAPAYRELETVPGLRIMETLEPAELMRRLPAYDVGLAIFNTSLNAAHLDTALPNKAFEYLASGLPVAAGPHRALRRLVEEEGVGLVVERAGDLAEALAGTDLAALRERVSERRALFTVEGHIGALAGLYDEVALTGVPV